ncbi:MAG: tetratricopeptide repeat protein [Thiogranum sp.]
MIVFRCKSVNLRHAWVLFAGLLLAACSQPQVKPDSQEPTAVTTPSAAQPEQNAGQPAAETGREELTASLLYGVLMGEIAGQRGRLDVSGAAYLQAAKQSNDPRIAERALKISIFAKQPGLAYQAAQRWVELAPDNAEARQTLAVLALRLNQQQEALDQFGYLLQNDERGDGTAYQSMLTLLAREPDKERALQLMSQLVALRPQDPQAHFAYARLAVHAEKWPLAEQEVARCLELKPGWTDALILQAQVNLKQDRGSAARAQMEAALQGDPDNLDLQLAYARLLVDLEDFEAARKQYRSLLKRKPDNGQVVYSLALLALEAGDLKEARTRFKKLVELDFQTQQAYYYLGAIAEEQKNTRRALKWYNKVDPEGDHWIEVQIRVARLEAQGGDVKAARDRLRTLRLAQPGQAQRLFLVEGEILSGIEWYEEAYKLYSEYLETRPDDLEILYARSLVAERLDRLEQAEKDLRAVLKVEPDNARALNALGYTLADRTDRYEEALVYVQKAFDQTPEDPAVIDSMGWVLYRLGRLQEARDHLQKAYDMTGDAEIAAHLGEVIWAMGDRAAARTLWNKARKEAPGDPVLEETVRRLSP